jgi:3-hydroxyisobutyrate dehydrogenase-like beta-hydroxyacid dehydrogenase
MRVGFIGLGNMGQGMADNLLKKGSDLTVFTRTRAKVDAMVARGAKGAASAAELASRCDLILVCLPDVKTSLDVLTGPEGVVMHAKAGAILVDHSTVDIATSKACAAAAAKRGVSFLDAPITGGPTGATNGTLAIMAGGERAAFDRAKPELDKMGANVRYMGPTGAGTAMKLINQLLVSVNCAAAAEAFALANSARVDINTAAEVLKVAWGQSRMVERNAPITASRKFESSAAPVRNLAKDMGILADLAKSQKLALPLTLQAKGIFDDMMKRGWTEHDIAGALLIIEERSKTM